MAHVERVVKRMGLEGCFEGVICFETLNPLANSTSRILCKPSVEAVEAAIQIAKLQPHKTVLSLCFAHLIDYIKPD